MRGLDKAIEEVQSARNRVARLYGLGRIAQEVMMDLTSRLEEIESIMQKYEQEDESN